MSIYATWLHLDADDEHEDVCNRYVTTTEKEALASGRYAWFNPSSARGEGYAVYDDTRACSCLNKGPLVYHGSHVNPDDAGQRGGSLAVCAIPNHCHPDVRGTGSDDGPRVEFIRFSLVEHEDTYHGLEPGQATVVLDRASVERLRDTLNNWLDADEVC